MKEKRRTSIARDGALAILVIGLTLGSFWRLTSWHHRLDLQAFLHWGKIIQGHPWTPVVIVAVFIVGGLVFFVHAILLWATVFTFDTRHALIYCEMGSFASALVVYGIGRVLRQDVVARIAGSYVDKVSRALAQKGILSLVLLHLFPICPFSMLNLLAGVTHIRFKDFLIGTFLGMTPGVIVLCLFGNRLLKVLEQPRWPDIAGLAAFILLSIWVFRMLRERWVPKDHSFLPE